MIAFDKKPLCGNQQGKNSEQNLLQTPAPASTLSLRLTLLPPACCCRGQVKKLLRQFTLRLAIGQPRVKCRNPFLSKYFSGPAGNRVRHLGRALCRYDTICVMRPVVLGILVLALAPAGAWAQTPSPADPVVVSGDHPRLFLSAGRLRLLRRERERRSARWQQFEALISGNAPMPEPGFAQALYYQVSGVRTAGRRAVNWALAASDLRQMALVYDWCQDVMTPTERDQLAGRMARRMEETAGVESIPGVRSRVLAAVALFDEAPAGAPDLPRQELNRDVHSWWEGRLAPALAAGRAVIPREDAYATMEMLHALADSARLDLRESAPAYFAEFPIEHLMSYYPAPYHTAEGDIYLGATRRAGEPDLEQAVFSRAAELAMVAFDPNAPSTQVLQGWLMHDRYQLRMPLGAPYEFLWANPYQPGLSYYQVPLVYYNPRSGRLYVRSSWEDDAEWFGLFDGAMQLFRDGRVTAVDPHAGAEPLLLDAAAICFAGPQGGEDGAWRLTLENAQPVFVVGLEPRHAYLVEVDDEEMYETEADPAGTVQLDDVPSGRTSGVRLHAIANQHR